MEKIITWDFGEDFIAKLADFILSNFGNVEYDFSRIACVFGGKRPALFLRRQISRKINRPFFPPKVFSMDEFVEYTAGGRVEKIAGLDSLNLIYNLAKKSAPEIVAGRDSLAKFMPWAKEIISFIEQLDLEDVSDEALLNIKRNAEIGYEVPPSINILLQHIVNIRKLYIGALDSNDIYSRGRLYRKASQEVCRRSFDEFDAVIFCNFFYLHTVERRIIGELYVKGKGICIFQGNSRDWPVLQFNSQQMGFPIIPAQEREPEYNLSLYRGIDIHSQVGIIRNILEKSGDKENTVIVVPCADAVIPLISEITPLLAEFNVSLGYPLKRSSLYVLFDALFRVQESRKNDKYYAKDYLRVLMHPVIKNLNLRGGSVLTRVMVHNIEELFLGRRESSISGCLFLSLDEIEAEEKIFANSCKTLNNMGFDYSVEQCRGALEELHYFLFKGWDDVYDFKSFSDKLSFLLNVLMDKSPICRFSFNSKVIEKFFQIAQELKCVSFCADKFEPIEIWEIFFQKLDSEIIAFKGSPLRGAQILGLFETRSLNFKNVIIMDVNESVLPKLKIYEPLIPRLVMLSLGLNRLEKEEEIQRYQFIRLIWAARDVHLIYIQNKDKERSRFIEELLWKQEKRDKKVGALIIPKAVFSLKLNPSAYFIDKTADMVEFLKNQIYSASRINVYLKCPVQFYYKYVLGLREQEDLLTDPQSHHIGTFIHEVLEDTFGQFRCRRPVIDDEFRKYFFQKVEEKFCSEIERRMKSDSFLLKKIIAGRLEKFLDHDARRPVAKIICLEEDNLGEININNRPIRFQYTIDRIDELEDGSYMIIDYKTGGVKAVPKKYDSLKSMEMNRQSIQENIRSFQLPLYYYFVAQRFSGVEVNACLYSIRNLKQSPFITEQNSAYKEEVMRICLNALEMLFAELFDLAVPFTPDSGHNNCPFCPFTYLCR